MLLPPFAPLDTVRALAEKLPAISPPSETLTVGLVTYAAGLASLTLWDGVLKPQWESRRARRTPWITPLTADRTIPPPTHDDLLARGVHYIGARDGVAQFVTLSRPTQALWTRSEEWSEYYRAEAFVIKRL